MKKKIIIEGMHCSNCEKHIKTALEKIDGVKDVKVNHKKGIAIVKLEKVVDEDILKKAVEEEDYKVVEIKKVLL